VKIKKSILRKIIREEAGPLLEGCPADLPCPYAAAEELRAAGASAEDVMMWVDTVVHTYVDGTGTGEEGVDHTHDIPGDGMTPIEIALENRRRAGGPGQKLSSRQLRNIIRESVLGPDDLVRRPGKLVLPRKQKRRGALRKRRH